MSFGSFGDYRSHIDLKIKLERILISLQDEKEEIKQFYSHKISQLYDEIAEKDIKIEDLEQKIETSQKKCLVLQWEIMQKTNLVDDLKAKISDIQQHGKQNINTRNNQLNLLKNKNVGKSRTDKLITESSRRININQYFKKITEVDTIKTKDKTEGNNSTFASLFPQNSIQFNKLISHNSQQPSRMKSLQNIKLSQQNIRDHVKFILPSEYKENPGNIYSNNAQILDKQFEKSNKLKSLLETPFVQRSDLLKEITQPIRIPLKIKIESENIATF